MILQIFCACVSESEPPEDGEVLAEDIDLSAVDRAPAGDDAVAGDLLATHVEIDATMRHIHVVFFEGALVEKHVDALACRQLAFAVLRGDATFAAADPCLGPPGFHLFKYRAHRAPPCLADSAEAFRPSQ